MVHIFGAASIFKKLEKKIYISKTLVSRGHFLALTFEMSVPIKLSLVDQLAWKTSAPNGLDIASLSGTLASSFPGPLYLSTPKDYALTLERAEESEPLDFVDFVHILPEQYFPAVGFLQANVHFKDGASAIPATLSIYSDGTGRIQLLSTPSQPILQLASAIILSS